MCLGFFHVCNGGKTNVLHRNGRNFVKSIELRNRWEETTQPEHPDHKNSDCVFIMIRRIQIQIDQ